MYSLNCKFKTTFHKYIIMKNVATKATNISYFQIGLLYEALELGYNAHTPAHRLQGRTIMLKHVCLCMFEFFLINSDLQIRCKIELFLGSTKYCI